MATEEITYPRQEALTRRFRLGAPRNFAIAPDGARIAFIRSSGGRDPVGSIWVAEPDAAGGLAERLVVDARELIRPDAELPAAERARRERLRESTTGITAFSADRAVAAAAFSLDGIPFVVDLSTGVAAEVAHPGPVVDPRLSPDGATVAYVCDRSLYATATAPGAQPVLLAQAESPTQSWGLADFVAAEELDRVRGLWWLSDSAAVLAEFADEEPVAVRWISDPARPEREPVPHRYPAAGTANPVARLFRIAMDGSRTQVSWDEEEFPYLATVLPDTGDHAGAVISVLSRDQRQQRILLLDATASIEAVRDRTTTPWVTLMPGVPCRAPDGALLEIVADTDADTFQLRRDDVALTPAGLQVTALVDSERMIVTAQPGPFDQGVYAVTADGVRALADSPGVHAAVSASGGRIVLSTSPDDVGTAISADLGTASGVIASLAERPVVRPRVHFSLIGPRRLACAVLWPTGHVPGSTRLPVILSPYGGPHHARVVHAAGAFASDQWLADQGFAVVVIDGAGTPGRGPSGEYEVAGDLATRVLQDQVDALAELGSQYPDLDLGRVGITGWSFGGYLAALAVLDRPDVFHVAVAGAPVTDWSLYDTGYTERYLGLPTADSDAYRRTSLIERADRLTRPLLLIHGLADDNVLAAHTLQLSSALLAAGKAHTVLPLSGVTHFTPQEVVAENLLRLEVDFLRTHLHRSEDGSI